MPSDIAFDSLFRHNRIGPFDSVTHDVFRQNVARHRLPVIAPREGGVQHTLVALVAQGVNLGGDP